MKKYQYVGIYSMIALVVFMMSGCSTMFGRQHDEEMVTFDSNVSDVEVVCSGKRVDTPGSIPLRQSKSHSCTAEKEGYESKAFRIRSGTSWSGFGHSTAVNTATWGWWTLGIGTGVGWLIDWPSGAMRNLKEENIYLDMKPQGSTGVAAAALQKTVDVGKALVTTPVEAVQGATAAALDAAVHDSANKVGVESSTVTATATTGSSKVTKI